MTYDSIVHRLLDIPSSWLERQAYRSAAGSLTFGTLRERMLGVAGWLATSGGVRAGDRVAVCLPKSLETVQAIYGILAAGAVFVPLPILGPPSRLEAMLASIEPRLILTTPELAARVAAARGGASGPPVRTIGIGARNGDMAALLSGVIARRTMAEVSPDDLAVVFFTSGSTGVPKGVMWSYRSMDRATAGLPRWGRLTGNDRLISTSPLHYSSSAELFFPAHSGASSFLLSDDEALFPDRVAAAIERERITTWTPAATAVRLLVESGSLATRDLRCLRRIEIYGERMPMAALRQAMAALPQTEFCNLYAATEAFDMVELVVPRSLPEDLATLPLGRPSPIYDFSLRDEEGNEVAPGETGEICVVGPSVMIGYWKEPALTAAKRLDGRADSYRTGDLAFLGEDGLLHLVGRRDQLVKLRGHRFELGEIEVVLKTHPAVREAVAVAIARPQEVMEVRAVVLVADGEDPRAELRGLCARKLPGFARPTRIEVMQRFPLLASGKVDRQALKALLTAE